MATWHECFDSRNANIGRSQPTAVLRFVGVGTEDDADANNSFQAYLAAQGAIFPDYQGMGYSNYSIKAVGAGVWFVEVNYTRLASQFQFDTTGGTQKLTHSLNTTSRQGGILFSGQVTVGDGHVFVPAGPPSGIVVGMPLAGPGIPTGATVSGVFNPGGPGSVLFAGGVATKTTSGVYTATQQDGGPDFYQAINWDGDSVQGVEATVPVYKWVETYHFDPAAVTTDYIAAIFALTGQINFDTFRGYLAGDVLFLGARGTEKGQEDWEISFEFAASPSKTDFYVGGIHVAAKVGWDYLWVRTVPMTDPNGQGLIPVPVAVECEQVYPYGDFGTLNIGP